MLNEILDFSVFRLLFDDHHYTTDEINQLAVLLTESRHNRVDYFNMPERMTINVNYTSGMDDFDFAVEDLVNILTLQPPNLTELLFDINHTAYTSVQRVHRITDRFRRLEPVCSTITRLHLLGDAGGPKHHAHVAGLLAALSRHLVSLKLTRFSLDPHTLDSLARCESLHELELRYIRDGEALHTALPSLTELRIFHYAYDQYVPQDLAVSALARSCPRLESFTIESDHPNLEPIAEFKSMLALATDCLALKTLCLVRYKLADDRFVTLILLRHCRALKRLHLNWCPNLRGGTAVRIKDGAWAKLETLSLQGCSELALGFLRTIVASCPRLQELVVPDHLANQAVEIMTGARFVRQGVRRDHGWDQWKRSERGKENGEEERGGKQGGREQSGGEERGREQSGGEERGGEQSGRRNVEENKGVVKNVEVIKVDVEGNKIEEGNVQGNKVEGNKVEGRNVEGDKVEGINVEGSKVEEKDVEENKVEESKVEEKIVEGYKGKGNKVEESVVPQVVEAAKQRKWRALLPSCNAQRS
ncbi:hypothetical protein BC936DRAFT_139120 [Jimgerdemannia flammicorona]|uniref:F-box domain-containing protein n=1 Tax=Jimgerdemannia flammicorona TaxID=994334 RepID=A0A433BAS6_9FUNG|nr:hypothetical protein BC936DRAFT_139120 [Jimgerdemannia flammicorona]